MTKVKVEFEIEVPSGILVYDLGTEFLCCHVCGTRMLVGPCPQGFGMFTNNHTPCIIKHAEAQRLLAEQINATRGGPNDR